MRTIVFASIVALPALLPAFHSERHAECIYWLWVDADCQNKETSFNPMRVSIVMRPRNARAVVRSDIEFVLRDVSVVTTDSLFTKETCGNYNLWIGPGVRSIDLQSEIAAFDVYRMLQRAGDPPLLIEITRRASEWLDLLIRSGQFGACVQSATSTTP